jgi:hypothetical protein
MAATAASRPILLMSASLDGFLARGPGEMDWLSEPTKGEIRMLSDKEMKKADGEIEQLFEESEIFPAEKSPPDQT